MLAQNNDVFAAGASNAPKNSENVAQLKGPLADSVVSQRRFCGLLARRQSQLNATCLHKSGNDAQRAAKGRPDKKHQQGLISKPENHRIGQSLLPDGNATPEEKQQAYTALANYVAKEMGIDPVDAKILVSEQMPGSKGFFSAEDPNSIYVVDSHSTTGDAANTVGNEMSHAIDHAQDGDAFDQSQEYRDNRNEYSDLAGDKTEDYLNFNYSQNDHGDLNQVNQFNGSNTSNATAQANAQQAAQLNQDRLIRRSAHPIEGQKIAEAAAGYAEQYNTGRPASEHITDAQAAELLEAQLKRRISTTERNKGGWDKDADRALRIIAGQSTPLILGDDGQPIRDRNGELVPLFGTSSIDQKDDDSIFNEANYEGELRGKPEPYTTGDLGDAAVGVVKGIPQGVAGYAEGVVDLVTDPAGSAEAAWEAIKDPQALARERALADEQSMLDHDLEAVGERQGQTVGGALAGAATGVVTDKIIGAGVDAIKNSSSPNLEVSNQDLVDSIIESRATNNTSSHGTLSQGMDGDGQLTPIRESIPAADPADAIHAETQTIQDLEGKPKPHTIVVDSTPCTNCSSAIKEAGVDTVIVPQNPSKPNMSPKSTAVKAAQGKVQAVPREVELHEE